jgi:hypothetical protein
LRVTRVGTHAVSAGSSTSLWDRLKQHYGTGKREFQPSSQGCSPRLCVSQACR